MDVLLFFPYCCVKCVFMTSHVKHIFLLCKHLQVFQVLLSTFQKKGRLPVLNGRTDVRGHGSFCAGAAAAEMHPVFEEYHLACLLWMFFHRGFIRQSIFGRKDVPTIQAGTSSAYGVCSGRMAKSEQFPDFQRRTKIANSLWIA